MDLGDGQNHSRPYARISPSDSAERVQTGPASYGSRQNLVGAQTEDLSYQGNQEASALIKENAGPNASGLTSFSSLGRGKRWLRIQSAFKRFWVVEVVASVASVAILLALAIILRESDNKPLNSGSDEKDYFFGQLTLNGLVALLATIIEAMMMVSVSSSLSQLKWIRFSNSRLGQSLRDFDLIDSASRNLKGSARLLFSGSRLQFASIGALITIFALAFDTFTQQVVATRTVAVNSTQHPPIAATTAYAGFAHEDESVVSVATLPLLASVYNSIFDPQSIVVPTLPCTTGNCTYPIYSSLSICGSCSNISSIVNRDCIPTYTNATEQAMDKLYNCTTSINSPTVNYTSTSDFQAEQLVDVPQFGSLVLDIASGYPVTSSTGENSTIISFLTVDLSGRFAPIPLAFECELAMCAQAYNVTVASGQQNWEVLGSWNQSQPYMNASSQWFQIDGVPSSIPVPNTTSSKAYSDEFFPSGPGFYFYELTMEGLSTSLYDILNINVTGGSDGDNVFSTDVAFALYNVSDWSNLTNSLALSMTNAMQRTGQIADSRFNMIMSTNTIFVHVRWGWLAYPTAMVFLSVVFLLFVIVLTARSRTYIWKDDSLPLLLSSLDRDLTAGVTSVDSLAKKRVVFDATPLGGVFRQGRMQ